MANQNVGKMLAGVSIIVVLSYAFSFALYKSFNQFLDKLVYEFLDFLQMWNIDLSVEMFWLVLAAIFFVLILVLISKGES